MQPTHLGGDNSNWRQDRGFRNAELTSKGPLKVLIVRWYLTPLSLGHSQKNWADGASNVTSYAQDKSPSSHQKVASRMLFSTHVAKLLPPASCVPTSAVFRLYGPYKPAMQPFWFFHKFFLNAHFESCNLECMATPAGEVLTGGVNGIAIGDPAAKPRRPRAWRGAQSSDTHTHTAEVG